MAGNSEDQALQGHPAAGHQHAGHYRGCSRIARSTSWRRFAKRKIPRSTRGQPDRRVPGRHGNHADLRIRIENKKDYEIVKKVVEIYPRRRSARTQHARRMRPSWRKPANNCRRRLHARCSALAQLEKQNTSGSEEAMMKQLAIEERAC